MNPQELGELPVSEFLTPARTFDPDASVSQVIGYLRDSKLNEAFVDDGSTTTVAVMRDMLRVQDIKTKISTLASHVPRLNLNNRVSDAALIMFEHRVRSLPVYGQGKLSRQVHARSILQRLTENDLKVRISRIMTPNPVCIDASEPVSRARSEMMKRNIDQLPVLKTGKLRGMISSSSIVFNILPSPDRLVRGDLRQSRLDFPVENLSSADAVTSEASDIVNQAFREMEKNQSTYSVIMNLEEIQGIVTYRDFMRFLTISKNSSQTPAYIVGLPEEPFEAEATRSKFNLVVKYLGRSVPDITEARAVIKTGETRAARRKYQVRVFVMTPGRRLSYDAFGYELPDIFDELASWAKSLASKGVGGKAKRRQSVRETMRL